MPLRIAFIGFGEVGQLFCEQLSQRPDVAVAAYDTLFDDAARGPALRDRAGAFAAASVAEACRGARLVISAVTADQAVAAARAAAPALTANQTYIDLNSVSPATKAEVAAAIAGSDAGFIEFAVMAPVAGPGLAVPILAGGEDAETVADFLRPLGMDVTPVSVQIGVASATKLCRSIVIKGMEALMVDLSLVTAANGVLPAVLASLQASYPGMDWEALVATMPGRVRRHGVRRAAEMREVGRMLEEAGLSGDLAEAIARRHERFAGS
ncbi:DUF1932 domain-containing protein [Salinarimonas soli]|nr:DUF1932 domain-containing protein [Salinarimonas soli]